MPLPNNEFTIPDYDTTLFNSGDQLDLHAYTSDLLDLGDARDLVNTPQNTAEVISAPEFGIKEAMRVDEWIEWMRTEFGNQNWDLRD